MFWLQHLHTFSDSKLMLVQEFSSDMNSRPVKRIEDVVRLRTAQFSEDSGPIAHPIRPESYIKMDNFYTVTVYEKGAEIIRVYHTLLGKQGFRYTSSSCFSLLCCSCLCHSNGHLCQAEPQWLMSTSIVLPKCTQTWSQLQDFCPCNRDKNCVDYKTGPAFLLACGAACVVRLQCQ